MSEEREQTTAEGGETTGRQSRRSWLEKIGAGLATLAGVAVAAPVLTALLGAMGRRPREQWIDLGPVDQFRLGETQTISFTHPHARPEDGGTAKLSAYVRRVDSSEFLALAPNCTHLGCPVSWFHQSGLFMCPCHGGVYYEDGSRAAGPPPRGLYRYPTKVVNGNLKIRGGHLPTLHNTFEHPA